MATLAEGQGRVGEVIGEAGHGVAGGCPFGELKAEILKQRMPWSDNPPPLPTLAFAPEAEALL